MERGNCGLLAGVLLLSAACGLCASWGAGRIAQGELLQVVDASRPFMIEGIRPQLALPAEDVPTAQRRREDLPLPYEPEPRDAAGEPDALEIAQRRIEEAYAALKKRQEGLLREKEAMERDQTDDVYERRLHLERLDAAAKELAEYARVLNAKKEEIDARIRHLEIAASAPYVAYSDAVQKSFGQFVVPPPAKNGVQVRILCPPWRYLLALDLSLRGRF